MANVTGQINVNANFSQVLSGVPAGANSQAPSVAVSISAKFNPQTSGTAADQVDLKYTKTLTFTASTPQILDLTALTDIAGAAVNFARIKSIVIKPRGLVDGVVLKLGYSGVTTNAWTSLVSNPGQLFLQSYPTTGNDAFLTVAAPGATGYAVGSTNKLLNLDPGTAAFSVDVEITGCSA